MIPSNAKILIEAIKSTGKRLNSQESGFLASVAIQTRQGRYLQPKQAKWLQDIYQKVTDISLINARGNK